MLSGLFGQAPRLPQRMNALGRTATIVGWLCVLGLGLVIVDMIESLAYIPEGWWHPATQLTPGRFDLRTIAICPGFAGWSGAWGYLTSLFWLPFAACRAVHAIRAGGRLRPQERILLTVVPALIGIVQFLLRATPLKYGYPLL